MNPVPQEPYETPTEKLEKKLATFWLGIPELPNKIKIQISQAVWEDEKLVKEDKKNFLFFLTLGHGIALNTKGLWMPISKMHWWGYKDHHELPKVVGDTKFARTYDRYYMRTFLDEKKGLVHCILHQGPLPMFPMSQGMNTLYNGGLQAREYQIPHLRNRRR